MEKEQKIVELRKQIAALQKELVGLGVIDGSYETDADGNVVLDEFGEPYRANYNKEDNSDVVAIVQHNRAY